jgi:hypothetical protein
MKCLKVNTKAVSRRFCAFSPVQARKSAENGDFVVPPVTSFAGNSAHKPTPEGRGLK